MEGPKERKKERKKENNAQCRTVVVAQTYSKNDTKIQGC